MKIVFRCPACGTKLSADAGLAGRSGRCRTCGHRFVVPAAPGTADGHRHHGGGSRSTTGGRRPGTPAGHAPEAAADGDELPDWQAAVASQLRGTARSGGPPAGRGGGAGRAAVVHSGYSLRPVTPVAVPTLAAAEHGDAGLGGTFEPQPEAEFVATLPPVARLEPERAATGPTGLVRAYRWVFARLVRASTWISETSYTVSFIVITLAIAGGMAGRHALAQWGTLAVVVLNLVGLAGDLASLVALSFRRGPVQGALFLVPPFTLYYLWSDWERYREAVGRLRIPLVTLSIVVAAYLLVPWLRGGTAGHGPVAATVERVIGAVEKDFGRPGGAIDEGLEKARNWIREAAPRQLPAAPGSQRHDRAVPGGGP